jgi:hypothetical protein
MPSNKGTKWYTSGAKNETDIYEHYKKTTDNPVDKKTFKRVLMALNTEFMRMIIYEGKEVRMPYLNMLSVRKTKNKTVHTFDYGHYNKTGEKRLHDNEHSDGYSARFHWTKSKCLIPGKKAYSLDISRDNSRALAAEMKKPNGHTKYIELNGRKIH